MLSKKTSPREQAAPILASAGDLHSTAYEFVIDEQTWEEIKRYKAELVDGSKTAGHYVEQQLRGKNVAQIADEEFLHCLLASKQPTVFAESKGYYNGANPLDYWSETETAILGNICTAVDVKIYDNGKRPKQGATPHIPPLDGTLLFVNGVLLANGEKSPDCKAVVRKDGTLDEDKYKQLIKGRLLSALRQANKQAERDGQKAFISCPGLGCGQFAGKYVEAANRLMQEALEELLKENKAALGSIAGISLDLYGTGRNSTVKIGETTLKIRDSQQDDMPQLTAPEKFSAEYKGCKLYKIVAGDHLAMPGCDYNSDSPNTDEGATASSTDLQQKTTGITGVYNPAKKLFEPGNGSTWKNVHHNTDGTAKVQLTVNGNVKITYKDGRVTDLKPVSEETIGSSASSVPPTLVTVTEGTTPDPTAQKPVDLPLSPPSATVTTQSSQSSVSPDPATKLTSLSQSITDICRGNDLRQLPEKWQEMQEVFDEIADGFTSEVLNLYIQLTEHPKEFYSPSKFDTEAVCPNIVYLTRLQNKISYWAAGLILGVAEPIIPEVQALFLASIINLASQLANEKHDYFTAFAIYSSIVMNPIDRLSNITEMLPEKSKQQLEDLKQLFSPTGSFSFCTKVSMETPGAIPMLPPLLNKAMLMLEGRTSEEAIKDTKEKIIEPLTAAIQGAKDKHRRSVSRIDLESVVMDNDRLYTRSCIIKPRGQSGSMPIPKHKNIFKATLRPRTWFGRFGESIQLDKRKRPQSESSVSSSRNQSEQSAESLASIGLGQQLPSAAALKTPVPKQDSSATSVPQTSVSSPLPAAEARPKEDPRVVKDRLLRMTCSEVFSTELTYINELMAGSDIMLNFVKQHQKLDLGVLAPVARTCSKISRTAAAILQQSGSNPDSLSLQAIVDKTCAMIGAQIENTQRNVSSVVVAQDEISTFIKEHEDVTTTLARLTGKPLGVTYYTIMPVQRFPRYMLLMRDMLSRVGAYNDTVPQALKIKTDRLERVLSEVKTANTELNEAVRAKEQILLQKAFGASHKDLIEVFSSTNTKLMKQLDPKTGEKIARALAKEPSINTIRAIFSKYAISGETEAFRKQLFIQRYVQNPDLQELLQYAKNIQAQANTSMRLEARMHGHTSVTAYLMIKINEAYGKKPQNRGDIDRYLQQLGLNLAQLEQLKNSPPPLPPRTSQREAEPQDSPPPLPPRPSQKDAEKHAWKAGKAAEQPKHSPQYAALAKSRPLPPTPERTKQQSTVEPDKSSSPSIGH